MMRRGVLAGVVGLAGCSVLPDQPFLQKRDWPLVARRPVARPPRTGGPILQVRSILAAPGLERRGLQWRLPDGSVHIDFYEEWAVPPAQAVEDALRQWLADTGIFSAVVGTGSQVPADFVLEGELTEFVADPPAGTVHAALALVLLDERRQPMRVALQKTEAATAPLSGAQPPAVVQALRTALEEMLRGAEQAVTAPGGAVEPRKR